MDGISGVILIWLIDPLMANISFSLAGRNEKYGTLWWFAIRKCLSTTAACNEVSLAAFSKRGRNTISSLSDVLAARECFEDLLLRMSSSAGSIANRICCLWPGSKSSSSDDVLPGTIYRFYIRYKRCLSIFSGLFIMWTRW